MELVGQLDEVLEGEGRVDGDRVDDRIDDRIDGERVVVLLGLVDEGLEEGVLALDAPEVPAPEPASGSAAKAPPAPVPSQPAFAHRVPLADGLPPYVPLSNHVPDTRVPFSIKVNPFKHRR